MGSASELKYYFILARELEFINTDGHERLTTKVDEVQKMLASLIRKLRTNS